jgi:6-phosphogluconolactonase
MTESQLHVDDDPALRVGLLLATAAVAGAAIALTGGSSPARAYEHAAAAVADWSKASVWWGDERCVPPDDERSNYGLAKLALLDRLEAQPAIHRIRGEVEPAEAARAYEQEIAGVRLGLLLLGLGRDGHVASLFPGSPQLQERERLVTSGPAALPPYVDRVTLTLPALLAAEQVIFLVSGPEKADAVERAFRGPVTDEVPASLLRTGRAPISVFLDAAAAGSGL